MKKLITLLLIVLLSYTGNAAPEIKPLLRVTTIQLGTINGCKVWVVYTTQPLASGILTAYTIEIFHACPTGGYSTFQAGLIWGRFDEEDDTDLIKEIDKEVELPKK